MNGFKNRGWFCFIYELFDLVNTLRFRKTKSKFQKKLSEDIKSINNDPKTLTFADKTSNMYKITKEEYNKLLHDSITNTYKKANNDIDKRINEAGKTIINKKNVANRVFVNGHDNSFITLKDHKPNFENNPKVRLINPAKNEIGRSSKVILDKIKRKLKNITKVNQWKDTSEVINWFNNIGEKVSTNSLFSISRTFTHRYLKTFYRKPSN